LELKINPEYEVLLPKLTKEEYESLKESIKKEGQHYAITINDNSEILDGHHRNKACLELEIEPYFEVKHFDDKLSEKMFVIESNLRRRHLHPLDAARLGVEIEKIEAERAAQRQGTRTDLIEPDLTSGSNEPEVERARNIAARKAGLSPTTYYRAKTINEKGTPQQQQEVRDGETSISEAYAKIRQAEARLNNPAPAIAPPIPEGKYRCIVIDPPWQMKKIEREERPDQGISLDYPTMTLEEIGKLPIADLADAEGCHVYLWVTHKMLPEGLKLFEQWGVKYQCLLTWVKNVGFTPFSWMYDTEHVLFGRIGSLDLLKMGLRLSFHADVTKHSEKPEIFYARVCEASPGPRLDMFQRKQREGFVGWGNETEKLD
jgi:N6-adenosine-specific RNA methylase IME4/ParB-like chromosome segregation protein Spo0J